MSCDGFDGTHLLAFFVGGVLALLTAGLVQQHVAQRLQKRNAVQPCKTAATGGAAAGGTDAAKDIEKGTPDPVAGNALSQDVAHLCDKIRTVLESEVQQGATMKEVEDRVDGILKLSKNEPAVSTLRESAAPASSEDHETGHPKMPSKGSVDTRTPSSSNRSGSTDRDAEQSRAEELPGAVALPPDRPMGKAPLPPPLPPANLEPIGDEVGPPKMFGPTDRQCAVLDPPEKCLGFVDEDESQRNSVVTLQRIFSKRDAQTTELHRQLRDTRQQLWQQTAEARAATARLNACLSDASRTPHEQAEAIVRLQSQVKELSGNLAEARHQEQQWASIAKRQRAYLQQSERISQEGMQILRRHPAGEVFLAPAPVYDDEEAREEPVWDVGTGRTSSGGSSHCNPYVIDSWPFEPNVLAARASVPPNLNQWEEGDEDYDDVDEDLDEDEHPHWQWDEQADPDEEDTSSLEPERMKAPSACRGSTLPPLTVPVGGSSARSL